MREIKMMEWLKPTKGKVITNIVLVIVWNLLVLLFTSGIVCKMCFSDTMIYNSWPDLIKSCGCTVGATFPEFVLQLFILLILPAIIVYFFYSLISLMISKLRT